MIKKNNSNLDDRIVTFGKLSNSYHQIFLIAAERIFMCNIVKNVHNFPK